MSTKPHRTSPTYHPGSSKEDIENEPDWTHVPGHRIGFRDNHGRILGYTHHDEKDWDIDHEFLENARQKDKELRQKAAKGEHLTVADFMKKQENYYLRMPSKHPLGWRYVLHTTESFIKHEQGWPMNIQRQQKDQKQKQDEKKGEESNEQKQQREKKENEKYQNEHQWRRGRGENVTHKEEYSIHAPEIKKEEDSLKAKYTPQERALLRVLKEEREYVQSLEVDSGDGTSPQIDKDPIMTIDEIDQFTPDNWIPRSSKLVRVSGKHPLNAEPDLSVLYDAGLITPNRLHFVRNHGAVPHILWETHQIIVQGGALTLSMDDLVRFDSINIPIAMACDGNRRKELNMIKRSKGFDNGPATVSCAYWKGALLRDILLAAGVQEPEAIHSPRRRWVNFEGADKPAEGKYATCIPLKYAMDPTNDVIIAYEMNNQHLPPDHGYPARVMIPGYVGGRCVKWLSKIWVSDKENDSYYHVFDNRVLPSFVTERDSEFAETMFNHPSTVCNEQNLNSAIVKPAHGEKIDISKVGKDQTYRIEGYAYDGGGCEVQRVEVSLNGGKTWLYCTRKFPHAPIRHGKKFWTWLFWHIDIEIASLLRAESVTVRCFNVFKNTQPEQPSWNLGGFMNNCWYVVKPETIQDSDSGNISLSFQHPCEPGTAKGGWMKPSTEEQIESIKHEVSAPQKQFTREEIEKHNKEDDCWIVVNGKVYDATSVLDWHPGGSAPIMGHAGKVHAETSDEFQSIHDDYAEKKLSECVIGNVTEKAKSYMKRQAEEAAKKKKSQKTDGIGLTRNRWTPVRLQKKKDLSSDTKQYTFILPPGTNSLGLSVCQHIHLGFHFLDRMVIRSYTPTRPVLENEEDGTFDLVVKTYPATKDQPGGTLSNILSCLRDGEEIEVKGPIGEIIYKGHGQFNIDGKDYEFDNISLVLGGSAITPGYQLIDWILKSGEKSNTVGSGPQSRRGRRDETKIKLVDANKTEEDILLREDLDELCRQHPGQFQMVNVLSHAKDDWKGERGFVTEDHLKKYMFPPSKRNVVLVCGPPPMINKAVLPALKDWGYKEDENLFGF